MKPNVMIVDDDDDLRRTASIILTRAGYSVCVARNGKECLGLLAGGFKGILLMDVMMPEMSGWSTVRAIVEAGYNRDCLICMLTAVTEPGEQAEGLEEQVIDYLPKPFSRTDLIAMVSSATSHFSA